MFIGDNVDKKVWVCDEQLSHHGKIEHPHFPSVSLDMSQTYVTYLGIFLLTHEDIERVKENLVMLVSWLLTKYFKSLSPLSNATSKNTSTKS